MKVTIHNLQKFLAEKKFHAEVQKETDQVLVLLKISGHDFPLFLRIFEGDLLQLFLFLPTEVKPGTFSDLARFLHLINKDLDLPGFGMDETKGMVFFRYMLSIPGKQLDESALEAFMKALELIGKEVAPSVIAVASGLTTLSDILHQVKKKS